MTTPAVSANAAIQALTSQQFPRVTETAADAAQTLLFQKFFVLATGAAASNPGVHWLKSLVTAHGDLAEVRKVVDTYMDGVEASKGRVAALQQIIDNGFGVTISAHDANEIALELALNKVVRWSSVFEVATCLSGALGDALNARAELADHFADSLDRAGKVDFYAGESVVNAVRLLLKSSDPGVGGITAGKSGFTALADALSAGGIRAAVVDGYIAGATVFVDSNGDGKANPGEWVGKTDAQGFYVLPPSVSGAKVSATGGKDLLTQKDFVGVLSAPAGSTVMNPLTTLVQTVLDSNPSASVKEAKGLVSKALGVPDGLNLLTFDPVAVLASGSASESEKAAALGVQSSALQVANTMTQMASLIAAAPGDGQDRTAAASLVAQAIVAGMQTAASSPSTASFDLTKPESLTTVLQTAATKANAMSVVSQAGQLAAVTVASNQAAEKATSIEALAKSAVAAQSAVTALSQAAQSGSFLSVINSFTGTNFDNAVQASKPGELTAGVTVPPATPAPTNSPAPTATPAPTITPTPTATPA
ncbi:MAG: hypothetical protein EBV69_05065, partial [Oxalobacteraceae bacterium]|nr:hypothetical protein [Oxalobacteraceae bacterium]